MGKSPALSELLFSCLQRGQERPQGLCCFSLRSCFSFVEALRSLLGAGNKKVVLKKNPCVEEGVVEIEHRCPG
jgi:hypothetical protein